MIIYKPYKTSALIYGETVTSHTASSQSVTEVSKKGRKENTEQKMVRLSCPKNASPSLTVSVFPKIVRHHQIVWSFWKNPEHPYLTSTTQLQKHLSGMIEDVRVKNRVNVVQARLTEPILISVR